MALINRISRVFQADIHAVLDRIEEPDLLLKQAIREMEEELSSDEQRLKILEHEQSLLNTRKSEIQEDLASIDSELDLCFNAGKNDLARSLIKRQLEIKQFCKHLTYKDKALQQSLTNLTNRFDENQLQLVGMQQKAALLAEDIQPNYNSQNQNWNKVDFSVSEEDVEIAFLREQQLRSQS